MSGEGTNGSGSPTQSQASVGAEQQDVTHPMKAFASELSKLQNQVQALQSTKLQEQVLKLRESVKGKSNLSRLSLSLFLKKTSKQLLLFLE